jgi:PadR family transcriptional regulator, regulatory protein PadR
MPNSDTELFVLAALEARELYGREILDEVAKLTSGKRRMALAGLYTTLHRMETKGLIRGSWGDDDETREGARRRYYKISGAGAKVLRDVRRAIRPQHDLAWGEG